MKKQVRRTYSDRGTRRTYTGVRIDVETMDKLKRLSELWKTSIIQVVERLASEATEKSKTETANESE